MSVEIRQATAEEMADLGILGGYVFGGVFGDGAENDVSEHNRPEWTLCAFVDGKLASSFANIPFTMRANGRAMSLAGVSVVGTQPEYRRRGLARRIHTQAFGQMREAGQPVASLWASQAAIYQRYGYAMSTAARSYTIDTVDIRFHDGDGGNGRVERIDLDTGYDTIKDVYIKFVAERMAYLHRAKTLWLHGVLEPDKADGPVWVAACHDSEGSVRGYVVYTLRGQRVDNQARDQEFTIRDLAWLDADAYRSLWSFIASHDLVGRVRWTSAPLDDPAPELLIEPRMLHPSVQEGTWSRIVDVPTALTSRGYDVAAELGIEVEDDPLTPWNDGVWHLEASPEGAHAQPSRQTPDIRLNVKALASLWSGFRSASELARWGFVEGDRQALARADEVFRTRYAPHCPDHF
ncbi:MAG: GNAT family N-acetyltransferase [Gammaproteobacteria bacterium]|nr:GNAT family N-acetyltransferase [Gammaproteobacteria bacterium]